MKRLTFVVLMAALVVACTDAGTPDPIGPPTATDAALRVIASQTAEVEPPVEAATKPLTVKLVKLTKSVRGGATASITIKTAAGARCSINVEYKSGPSTAKGLGIKKAKSNGRITWSWTVGTNTTRGSWPIDVDCSKGGREGSLSKSFRVK